MSFYFQTAKRIAYSSILSYSIFETQKESQNYFWTKKVVEAPDPKIENGSMYIWGNGYYQARPDWTNQFSNFSPKKITHDKNKNNEITENSIKFKDIIFTDEVVYGLDPKGKIWSFKNRKISSFLDVDDKVNFVNIKDQQICMDNIFLFRIAV